ncbi:MAG: AAA family ATPase, partial [Myxococcota bacterium]
MASSNAVCPSCGFSNPRVWRACARCGVSLRAAALRTPPPATMVTAPPRFDDEAGPTLPFDTAAIIEGVDSPVITEDYGSEVPASLEIELTQHGGERVGSVQIEMTNGGETAPEPADEEVEPPLVGQAEASQAIRTGIERAFSVGSPTLVSLEGEAESGKTRLLVYASEIAARQEPNVLVLYGACRKGGGDGPYAPFSRMLLERFGVTPASSPATVRGQMATHVSRALMTKDAIQVAETTHLLGHVAGIPFPDSPFLGPLADKPDELRRRAGGAVRRFIEGEGQQHPVLVLLDDMHHVESDGWEIAQELTRSDGHIAIVMAGDAPLGER